MSIALAQSVLGTHASGTYNNIGGSTSVSVSPAATSTGSLLILIGYYSAVATSGPIETIAYSFPTGGSGITWRQTVAGGFLAGTTNRGGATFFYSGNAPAQGGGTTFSLNLSAGGGAPGNTGNFVGECVLYEFTGVALSNSASVGGLLLDADAQLQSQTTGTPHTANLATTVTDLIAVASSATGAALSAGSGFTLGQTASNLTGVVGQFQYILNQPSGSIATSYLSGTPANWGCCSMAFKPAAATGNSSYGFFFG